MAWHFFHFKKKHWTYSLTITKLLPASPGYLDIGKNVNVWFKYNAPVPVYIAVRPFYQSKPSPHYEAHGMKLHPAGSGTGMGYFTIKKGFTVVDSIHIKRKKGVR